MWSRQKAILLISQAVGVLARRAYLGRLAITFDSTRSPSGSIMSCIVARLKSVINFIQCWIRVGFCSLFLLWFLSGTFMLYCEYPVVQEAGSCSNRRVRWTSSSRFESRSIRAPRSRDSRNTERRTPVSRRQRDPARICT